MKLFLLSLILLTGTCMAAEPIQLHPQNPHYFFWRGKPNVFIGSGEHYGAVLNLDFDFTKYLDTLQRGGLNLTRAFSGTYREVPGNFNIVSNVLAPAQNRFICPWARSEVPGYGQGGNKFDLTKWDEAYFARLKEFVAQAQQRGIVVEFVLFCPLYEDSIWRASPMNAQNNINGIGAVPKTEVLTLKHPELVAAQLAVTQKIVREVNPFDNVYFEICNEPYIGGVTLDWQARIADVIVETEKALPNQHLIAQNIANGKAEIEKPHPAVSIFNFHYATPPDTVEINYGVNKALADDETGFKGNADAVYRKEAWQFLLNGGSVFSHLDYSFTVGHESGDYDIPEKTPGGGGKAFRRQMKILKDFVEEFDFTRLKPAREMIKADGATVYALAEAGKSYAIYLHGKTQNASLNLPAGSYRATWINVEQGNLEKTENFAHQGGNKTLSAPNYREDIALKVQNMEDFSPTRVSDNHRFLLKADGTPFFYLADTAWTLFHRLSYAESDQYLRDRAAKKFTVIQAAVLAEHGGLSGPNQNGDLPFENNDPTRPNEKYLQHIDRVVDRAAELGLVVGMLPTWGAYWNPKWDKGPAIFTPENARVWGEMIGRRYKDRPIIWILGGDRPIENDTQRAIIRNMAEGLKAGDGGRHLMTYHPNGGQTSTTHVGGEAWLDFNMLQSGHSRDSDNYNRIAHDYAFTPVKPCIDGEPGYEDHPNKFDATIGYLNDYDVRRSAYWALFAGAAGHSYGCHDIWQFLNVNRSPAVSSARTPWQQALQLAGAGQMQFARNLLESRPILDRIPDQTLLVSDAGGGSERVQVTRGADGSYAFVYSAAGKPFTLDLAKLSGTTLNAYWFNPRRGEAMAAGQIARDGHREFTPPSDGAGHDWVLVLDDAAKNYKAPGR